MNAQIAATLFVATAAAIGWVTLVVHAVIHYSHVLRGELEPEDDETEDN